MDNTRSMKNIINCGVIAVIRDVSKNKIEKLAEALINGGITNLEITVDHPHAFEMIRILRDKYIYDKVLIGAGTVLDVSTAKSAIYYGAEFIVSPAFDREIIKVSLRYNKISIPGIFTPTEALYAIEAGADFIKLFPANSQGPSFIKALKGPMPHIPIIPTGGIDLNNASDFIKAGSAAIGLGGSLINKSDVEQGNFKKIEDKAKKFIKMSEENRVR